jgi:hypothetical protein
VLSGHGFNVLDAIRQGRHAACQLGRTRVIAPSTLRDATKHVV